MIGFGMFFSLMKFKITMESKKYGDGWLTCDVDELRNSLSKHVNKWLRNPNKEKEFPDLLDIANLAMFIGIRIKDD